MFKKVKRRLRKTSFYTLYGKVRSFDAHAMTLRNDKDHVWAFNAGSSFAGNPKWLFLYITKYRKDIDAYWLCDNQETIEYVRSLGYRAYNIKHYESYAMQERTGVFVVEQVKENIPPWMSGVKYINLFHGVGCKPIERYVNKYDFGSLNERIIAKYIKYNAFFKRNMLFLVTSPLMEDHFRRNVGLEENQILRAGYPRCIYQKYYEKVATFDHDIRGQKGLPADTRIAAYVPTYRDDPNFDFWGNAIPDFDRLNQKLKEQKMLLILKVHPHMEQDARYQYVRMRHENDSNLYFWNNLHDFYEIFDQIDLGIIDYSSIFYDMLIGEVPHFIRYFFDYENGNNLRDMVFDVKEMTCGRYCTDFEELLEALGDYETDDSKERERIKDLFWQYSGPDSIEKIVDAAMDFKPGLTKELPTLYSFDIFDTLIARRVLAPEGIFYRVQEEMRRSELQFPVYVQENYPSVRAWSERNVREYYAKTLDIRDSTRREIHFEEIFERMAAMYGLSREQTDLLMKWELDAEYENCIPCPKLVAHAEKLAEKNETVFLISDMYLPKEFVQKLVRKVSPVLAELPLYLSSDYGVQKTTRRLFLEAFRSIEDYTYKEWVHYGDNPQADRACPRKLGIHTINHTIPAFNEYEQTLTSQLHSYDGYLVAALLARFREQSEDPREYFAYAFISMYFVPYVHWAVHHALKQGMKCLYFISRDGHHLKRIADAVIQEEHLDIRTKYIYGSRRTWRIPSFIEDIDDEYFSNFGNFTNINSYESLKKALMVDDRQFDEFFPSLGDAKTLAYFNPATRNRLVQTIRATETYRRFLLDYAAQKRGIVEEYVRQEIDLEEPFAFVEYWGRGYTQDCFARIVQHTAGREMDVPYYYARSIYPTQGHFVRYNFSTNPEPLIFTEAIFANIPYKSVEAYQYEKDGRVGPVLMPADCDMDLHRAMEKYLPLFTKEYLRLPVCDRERLDRELYDFGLYYFREHPEDPVFAQTLACLIDSVAMYGEKQEFAPPITKRMLERLENGEKVTAVTRSVPMTLNRSAARQREEFIYLTETLPMEKEAEKQQELRRQQEQLLKNAAREQERGGKTE